MQDYDRGVNPVSARLIAQQRDSRNFGEEDLVAYWDKRLEMSEEFFVDHEGPWHIGRIVGVVDELSRSAERTPGFFRRVRDAELMIGLSFAHKQNHDKIGVYCNYLRGSVNKALCELPEEEGVFTHQTLSYARERLRSDFERFEHEGNQRFLEGRGFVREKNPSNISPRSAFEAALGRDESNLTEEDLFKSFDKRREMFWDYLRGFNAWSDAEIKGFGEAVLSPRSLDRVFLGDSDSFFKDLKSFEWGAYKSWLKRKEYSKISDFFTSFKDRSSGVGVDASAFNNFFSLLTRLESNAEKGSRGFKDFSSQIGLMNTFLDHPSEKVMSLADEFYEEAGKDLVQLLGQLGADQHDTLVEKYMRVIGYASQVWDDCESRSVETDFYLKLRDCLEEVVSEWGERFGVSLDAHPVSCCKLPFLLGKRLLDEWECSLSRWRCLKNELRSVHYFV